MENWRGVELLVSLLIVCIFGCVNGATDPNDGQLVYSTHSLT